MFWRTLLFVLFVALVPSLYLFLTHRRLRRVVGWFLTLPSVLLSIVFVCLLTVYGGSPSGLPVLFTYVVNVLVVLTFPAFAYVVLHGVLCVVCGVFVGIWRRKGVCGRMWVVVRWVSAAGAAVVLCGIVAGMTVGPRRIVVDRVEVYNSLIPKGFDGFRMVQISDLHLSSFRSHPGTLDCIVDRVMSLNPDVILFTGDLVTIDACESEPFLGVLGGLRAEYGVYSILGNHDYNTYATGLDSVERVRHLERLIDVERNVLGWVLLLNERVLLERGGDTIVVAGVENDGRPPFPSLADLDAALGNLSGEMYKILLTHDPSHWRRAVLGDTDVMLTLSGHTHDMQLSVLGWSPSKYFYPEHRGLYRAEGDEGRLLYVNTGLGGTPVPFRLGAWPQVSLITLHSGCR